DTHTHTHTHTHTQHTVTKLLRKHSSKSDFFLSFFPAFSSLPLFFNLSSSPVQGPNQFLRIKCECGGAVSLSLSLPPWGLTPCTSSHPPSRSSASSVYFHSFYLPLSSLSIPSPSLSLSLSLSIYLHSL